MIPIQSFHSLLLTKSYSVDEIEPSPESDKLHICPKDKALSNPVAPCVPFHWESLLISNIIQQVGEPAMKF